ncbi:glycosyl transferase family 2 [Cytobacillus oceanisediminis]|uniref:Glycosyl transferase family 2 n=1 Tax=Cytobacillus oceanisediminis TaxID=665099 RepID=A0A2V3A4B4_9BACI|nr:glycosyltransferase [Cytobacillus oceanisediminis]PWW31275.1 glycosyl transferase family 2 [Cytobacillus oceanisediminis]
MYLSVIIPVYNSEKYLSHCIESIMNQTFSDFEIILVNDGSVDNSRAICEDYSAKYSAIHAYTIKNSGSAYARNYGLEKSQGTYISFIDSDDWIHPNMFEKLTSISKKKRTDIVSCNLLNVKADGKENPEYSDCTSGYYDRERIVNEIFPFLVNSSDLSQHKWPMRMVTKIYNREFLIQNNVRFADDLRAAQDFVFSVTAMYYADSFYYLKDEFLYYYRENFDSRTHKHLHKAWDNYLSMNNHLRELLADSNVFDFSNQLELSKLHGVLSSISYVYRDGNKNRFLEKYKYTKEFARFYNLKDSVNLIDWEKTPLKKKIFIFLLKHRMYFFVALIANSYYVLIYRIYKKVLKGRGLS